MYPFSIHETIVVIAIIAAALALVPPQTTCGGHGHEMPPEQIAREQITLLRECFVNYRRDCGCYPSRPDGLSALSNRPSQFQVWRGPYIEGGAIPDDPWGNDYEYQLTPAELHLRSLGPDGKRFTGDDIAMSWPRTALK